MSAPSDGDTKVGEGSGPSSVWPVAGSGPDRRRSADAGAFDDFYCVNVGPLTRQIFAYLGDLAEAQDVVHEAFCRAFAHETSCSGMTTAINTSGGNRNWQLWGYGNNRPADQPITVQLTAYQFFYPDAAAAQHAFQQVQSQLSACAAERQVDIQTGKPLVNAVHQTASIANGFAFLDTLRTAAGQPAGTAILSSDSHEYLVQRGRVIALIEVLAADSTIDQGNNDYGVPQQMADHLCLAQHC